MNDSLNSNILRAVCVLDVFNPFLAKISNELNDHGDECAILSDVENIDTYFINSLKLKNINIILINKNSADSICEDVWLFLDNIIFVIVDKKGNIEITSQNCILNSFKYDNSNKLIDELNMIVSKSVDSDNKVSKDITERIEDYCLRKLFQDYNGKIINLYFNEDLYTKQQIDKMIETCKRIVGEDSLFDGKALLFKNTNEMYRFKEKKKMDNQFKLIADKYNKLHSDLSEVIIGQDAAIEKLIKGLYEAELNPPEALDNRPLACFFLFGPAGTGKTFLIDNLANMLGYYSHKFHMEQYAMSGDEIALFGSDRQFKNARIGDLADFVHSHENEKNILLFDEIEKASPEVLNSMLSMIGSGVFHDMFANKDISLENSILIFTSNAGKELFEDTSVNFSDIEIPTLLDALKKEIRNDGTPKFSPEFCSRIIANNVITFNHLSVAALSQIIRNDYKKLSEEIKKKHNIKLRIDPKLSLLSIYHVGKSDARISKNYASSLVKNELYEIGKQSDSIDLNKINTVNYSVDFTNIDKELKNLFVQNKKLKIGVVGNKDILKLFDDKAPEYELVSIKNEKELNDTLAKGTFAYFVDPFFGGIKNKALSITDYNTDGIKFLYKINETNNELPIYVIDVENNISTADKLSLIHDGAKKIITVEETEAFREDVLDLIEENYLENQANEISQKGWIVDFKSRQELSDDGKKINIVISDFRKYMAYDSSTSSLMVKQSDIPEERFDDVIDCNEAKEELKYYVAYLKDPVNFTINGTRKPKGVLLFGPPGTGKTMLARAMAGESGVNFISTTAADLVSDRLEAGETKVRSLFARARKYAPTIVFIDEIDAIGKKRNGSVTDSILTALLTEMDGFNKSTKRPVFVLAATNYGTSSMNNEIAELDQALLRRFDSNIYVGLPGKDGRERYINYFLQKKNIKNIKKGTIDTLVNCTVGKSLAIIENILEYAFRNAYRQNKEIDDKALLNALDQYQNGEIKEVNQKQAQATAIHEAGHTFVSYLVNRIPAYVTIEARANYGGYAFNEEIEDKVLTKNQLLNLIKIYLAGKAAEEVFLGEEEALNTGTSNDLLRASKMALDIICSFGMNDDLLIIPLDTAINSEEYKQRANSILDEQYALTKQMIIKNKKKIEKLVSALLEKGHLTKDELTKLLK